MKFTLKTLALPAVAFCATAAFAANQARVDVPFSFTAQGQSYPAGVYEVSINSDDAISMTSQQDATKHIMWCAGPADAAKTPAVVTFDKAGSDYTLKNVQLG